MPTTRNSVTKSVQATFGLNQSRGCGGKYNTRGPKNQSHYTRPDRTNSYGPSGLIATTTDHRGSLFQTGLFSGFSTDRASDFGTLKGWRE